MKLEAVDFVAVAECLAWSLVRRRERSCARRKFEDMAVPVKWSHRRGQTAHQAIIFSRIAQADRMPSDFLAVGIAFDLRSQCRREYLRAEAYAQYRQIRFHRIFDQMHLVAQPWIPIGLIDAHRTAHHDEAARALHARRDGLALVDANVLPCERGTFERVGDVSQILDRVMLQNINLGHLGISSTRKNSLRAIVVKTASFLRGGLAIQPRSWFDLLSISMDRVTTT